MSNDYKTVYEFDFSLICNYFKLLERQGPGSPEVTRLAASFIPLLPENAKIADLGCGTGTQTLELAKQVKGAVTGLDLFPGFIEILNRNAEKNNLSERVKGVVGTMKELPFEKESLDLIWSEGAIYNIGFMQGLQEWRQYLKTDGYIAVTEASWFTPERPEEIDTFWNKAYPEIDTIPTKVAQMEAAGYIPVVHFMLPESCWTEQFYAPQAPVQEIYLKEHADNPVALELIRNQREEQRLYNKYKDYYGYVFYIGKKR